MQQLYSNDDQAQWPPSECLHAVQSGPWLLFNKAMTDYIYVPVYVI